MAEEATATPAVALYDFVGNEEQTKLTFRMGETFLVLDALPGEWWWAQADNGEEGYIPAKYMRLQPGGEPLMNGGSQAKGVAGQSGGLRTVRSHSFGADVEERRVEGWLILWDDMAEREFYYAPKTDTYTFAPPKQPEALTAILAAARGIVLEPPDAKGTMPSQLGPFGEVVVAEEKVEPAGDSGPEKDKDTVPEAPPAPVTDPPPAETKTSPPPPGPPTNPLDSSAPGPPAPPPLTGQKSGRKPPGPPPLKTQTSGRTPPGPPPLTPQKSDRAPPGPPPPTAEQAEAHPPAPPVLPASSKARTSAQPRQSVPTAPPPWPLDRPMSHLYPGTPVPAPRLPPRKSTGGSAGMPPRPRNPSSGPPPPPPPPMGSRSFPAPPAPGGSLSLPPSRRVSVVSAISRLSTSREDDVQGVPTTPGGTPLGPETPVGKKLFFELGTTETADEQRQRQEQATRMRSLEASLQQFPWTRFVNEHFRRQRKGVLGLQQSAQELGHWVGKPLKQPVLKDSDPRQVKELGLQRRVMEFMGDLGGAKLNDPTLLSELLHIGDAHPTQRAELFAFIVKQVTGNPHPDSTVRGWALLCACTCAFPPEAPFRSYLQALCAKHRFDSSERGALAFHIWQRLLPTSTPPAPVRLSRNELLDISSSAVPRKIFGSSLEGVLRKEFVESRPFDAASVTDFARGEHVPRIAQLLVQCIYALGGLESKGLFRLASDADALSYFKAEIEEGDYGTLERTLELALAPLDAPSEFGKYAHFRDPGEPADLLKYWLRKLSDPLVEYSKYEAAVAAARANSAADAKNVYLGLPPANRATLKYLCGFFAEVVKLQAENMMDVNNLALVIAPNVLKNPDNDALLFARNADHEKRFLALLIGIADEL